ncbi:DPP IV N-terminal domain-containing protein [Formosa sp. S-31]|uniref:S9 family peptidase n=1 Tax=Formosa sp. S-31 TaxID=2790949 RepID=UPI003EBA9E00
MYRLKLSVIFTLLNYVIGFSQGSLMEYKKANAVDSMFNNKVEHAPKAFNWISNTSFWYVDNTNDGNRYLIVNAEEKTQQELFDVIQLTAQLNSLVNANETVKTLKLEELNVDLESDSVTFNYKKYRLSYETAHNKLNLIDSLDNKSERDYGYWGSFYDETKGEPVNAPDSCKVAYIKNYNLYIKDLSSNKESQLSYDGSQGNFYSTHIKWSPDGKKIMAYKVRPGEDHKIYFVESSPSDQFQPKLQSRDYLKPGDQLPFKSPQLFLVESQKHIPVSTQEFNSQYGLSKIDWRADSRAFTFEYNERGHQNYKVIEVDGNTGKVNVLIHESSPTFIDYSSKKYRYDIADGNSIVWTSERDGWNHIYLYNGDGTLKKQLTKGKWVVRKVIKVDEENKRIYFTASGLDKDQDPYFIHYCSVGFDGKNFKRLTSENANHKLTFSEDYKYYVDQYSRVDMAPVSVLKSTDKGKTVMELQNGDLSELKNTGWIAPEVFTAKGRDGVTDIWGIIVRPTTFDPNRKYPIIEYIYAGPHDSFVPKDFHSYYWSMSALAELGFIVVQIDGMGTSNRSKAFHDVCWQNLKDGGFPDRKLWMKAAAKKYPYMNIDKVGIHGTSAGGQNAGAALVFNSDFYDVAVASCGCHDNRMDKMWWNEQFMGYPVGPHYAACSNVENASQMGGHLMLILGEVDDNVDPASTMQFANALIKANKDFELVTIPGMGHSAGGDFGERKRRDFFVKHLMGVNPPSWKEVYN